MRKFRSVVLGAILLSLVAVAAACGDSGEDDGNGGAGDEQKGEVTVGSESFAEAQIVGEMYAQVLENAGYEVKRQLNIEAREIRLPAMESGAIDIAPDYVATLLSVIDPEADLSGSAEDLAQSLEAPLSEMGLTLLEPSNVIDTNAFVVKQETIDEFSLTTVSDLAGVAEDMTLGAPTECPRRPFCIPGLKEVYGVEFGDFKALEYGATITALAQDEIDVGLLFSTDGAIAENNFVVLEDDKGLQSADNITPLVREEILTAEIEQLLNEVSAAIETDAITELNRRANVEVEDAADLASEYLEELGLLD
jgi:osmoprotectant transport system substrate-binding protein